MGDLVVSVAEQLYLLPGCARSLHVPRLPDWWNPQDTTACRAYHELMASVPFCPEFEDDPRYAAYQQWERRLDNWAQWWNCRRCLYWCSDDGREGDCEGPELRCGTTGLSSMCEQWEPRIADPS